MVLIVSNGPEVDLDILQLLQRAELLKFNIPEYPLLAGHQDINYYPDIGKTYKICILLYFLIGTLFI